MFRSAEASWTFGRNVNSSQYFNWHLQSQKIPLATFPFFQLVCIDISRTRSSHQMLPSIRKHPINLEESTRMDSTLRQEWKIAGFNFNGIVAYVIRYSRGALNPPFFTTLAKKKHTNRLHNAKSIKWMCEMSLSIAPVYTCVMLYQLPIMSASLLNEVRDWK